MSLIAQVILTSYLRHIYVIYANMIFHRLLAYRTTADNMKRLGFRGAFVSAGKMLVWEQKFHNQRNNNCLYCALYVVLYFSSIGCENFKTGNIHIIVITIVEFLLFNCLFVSIFFRFYKITHNVFRLGVVAVFLVQTFIRFLSISIFFFLIKLVRCFYLGGLCTTGWGFAFGRG
jgi:hypothetical protein